MKHPEIIQGGMGVGISNWKLANATAKEGCLGVVSGTAIENVFIRRLQLGDPDNCIRQILTLFPDQEWASESYEKYYIEGGKSNDESFKLAPIGKINPSKDLVKLQILASFVEVALAKQGHSGKVGINLLEKIQLPTLPVLFGAILAKVDYVLMGAGIPVNIPAALDKLCEMEEVSLRHNVEDNTENKDFFTKFNPRDYFSENTFSSFPRPYFLAIVSTEIIAKNLVKKSLGTVDGFVVENHTAGGHNAPPRTKGPGGTRIFGDKDLARISAFRDLDRPFWLAGGFVHENAVAKAKELGAHGVQIGSAFALCEESGMMAELKHNMISEYKKGELDIETDYKLSPTGYPFKVAKLEQNIDYVRKRRPCDLGYLRTLYCKDNGEVGYRCPGEPLNQYKKKGGDLGETCGKTCLCNRLMASAGYPQVSKKQHRMEQPLVTIGEDLEFIKDVCPNGKTTYQAKDVVALIQQKPTNKIQSDNQVETGVLAEA